MNEQHNDNRNDQTRAVQSVARMLTDQCSFHRRDSEFTEEDIQNMYYDHLLAEIRNADYPLHSTDHK